MITRISTLVAIVVSGGILFSVGSPALAKGAGVNNGSISIKREAKLVRVIRVKLARRIAVEAGRGNGNETLKRLPPDLNRRDSQRFTDERVFGH